MYDCKLAPARTQGLGTLRSAEPCHTLLRGSAGVRHVSLPRHPEHLLCYVQHFTGTEKSQEESSTTA